MALYDELIAAGVKVDSHESDLYFEGTPEARAILEKPEHEQWRKSAKGFVHNDPKRLGSDLRWWVEVPFAYEPWWRARATKEA
jgi:hypothetical protein